MRFAISRRAAIALVTAVFAIGAPIGLVFASHQFGDVPNSNPFHADIAAVANAGVTSGCGGGNYCPDRNVTRAEMAAFMNRLGALASNKTPVVNADRVDGLDANDLVRAGYMSTGATTPIAATLTQYGGLLSITAPQAGFVIVTASASVQNVGCDTGIGGCVIVARVQHVQSSATSNWSRQTIQTGGYGAMSWSTTFAVSPGVNTFRIMLSRPGAGGGVMNGYYAEATGLFVPFGATGGSTLPFGAAADSADTEPK